MGYAFFAVVLSNGFKDYTGAYQFAALALRLNQDKLVNPGVQAKIYNLYAYFDMLREHVSVSADYYGKT
ncbi:hypothetical protein BGP_6670 [Beggiatoa sp. PS]|nr:hypothetical protein BGP_6670 [Beggiatoa sp. PS]